MKAVAAQAEPHVTVALSHAHLSALILACNEFSAKYQSEGYEQYAETREEVEKCGLALAAARDTLR